MIDFQLNLENLVRQDSAKMCVKGAEVKAEYRLHKDDVRDPKDPEGNPLTLWCLHYPQVDVSYVDQSEELVFEAAMEFFETDFIRYFAQKLVEERESRDS